MVDIQTDNFQPMAVINFLNDAREKVRQIDITDGVWNDDMKQGALLALAWVQAQVKTMAENRYEVSKHE